MTIAIVIVILLGYMLIASEHVTNINKSLVAMFCGILAIVNIAALQQVIDLTVGNDGLIQSLGSEHGGTHHIVGLDATAIIGEMLSSLILGRNILLIPDSKAR